MNNILFKRIPFLFLFITGMFLGFTAMSYGQAGLAVLSVNPTTIESPEVGEQFTISIDITNGIGVAGYQVTVNFDPTALKFISSENGNYIPAGAIVVPPLIMDDYIIIGSISLSGAAPDGDGTLASVTFEVVSTKTSTIELSDVLLPDADSSPLGYSTIDGMVTAPMVTVPIVMEEFSIADIVLIIDSSGSMNWNDPDNLRKTAAKYFIDLVDPAVQIAIVDFNGYTKTFADLTFADADGKEQLKSAVDMVDSDGDTDIAAGLQLGYDLLLASPSPDARKAAVLLTDGQDSETKTPQEYALNYVLQGWDVYTIGLGDEVDRPLLENIAGLTPEGDYFPATLDNMPKVYNEIFARVTSKAIIFNNTGFINQNQQITKKFLIDATVEQIIPSANWQGSTIELVLIDPNGLEITSQDAAANPNITYQAAPTFAIYTVENPMPGEWGMQATGTDIPPEGEQYNLIVAATSDFVTNFLSFEPNYVIGDPVRIGIRARSKTGQTTEPVLGVTASVEVVRPDGRIDSLELPDTAGNGVYLNEYIGVDIEGTYLVRATVENGFTREIQEQIVVGNITNVFIDGSTLTPTAGASVASTPSVISAVISGPAGEIDSDTIVLKVDGATVTHGYDAVNQIVLFRPTALSPGTHTVQLSVNYDLETTWEFSLGFTESRFELLLDSGLNVVSLPLMSEEPYTARSFSELLAATLVVTYDSSTQKYIAYVAVDDTDDGFAIEGGRGYIVNLPEASAIEFIGTAWSNQPSIGNAPSLDTLTSAWAFAINSDIRMIEPDKLYTLTARNLRTGVVVTELISTTGKSSTAVWADMNRNSVVQVGDMLDITLHDTEGTLVSGPNRHTVTLSDIQNAFMTVSMRVGEVRPKHTILAQNYPNPFNPETWIPYQLSEPTEVSIQIYDSVGHLVRTLELGMKSAGVYMSHSEAAYWDGKNENGERVASGVYFYSLQTPEFNATRRMVILK